ncbi:MAG TPA: N-acetylmuramoyl-L-alanine amidase [Chthoniobacterales bacterium]|nr:N-acetylmuramoyl-L-alanine amidase [Chthoniobacterales bacterium]
MVHFRLWVVTALILSGIVGTLVHAQLADEEKEKRAQFLKARAAASTSPDESPSPTPKAKAARHKRETAAKPSPSETPETKKTKHAAEEESSTPAPKKSPGAKARKSHKTAASKSLTPTPKKKHRKISPTPSASPKKSPKKSEENAEKTPAPHPSAAPTLSVTPQPPVSRAIPVPDQEAPQVTVEKSGFEEDQGLEPPPSPPPHRFGFWPWSWTRSTPAYRYLTRSVIEEIRRAPVQRRRWQFIVVHNSGTRQGNARVFDYYHRHVRRMRNGLAYQFVIGNGTSTGNGQIEVGDRWRRQINGGHVHSDYLNNISLGICLVGDFNRDQPTGAQLESCEELIRYLRERCGKIDRHDIVVRPHRQMNPPRWPTDCPGDAFPYSWFRRFGE